MRSDCTSFENNFIQTRNELACDNPEAFACITIDGFPDGEDAEGAVICEVWMTIHKDVIVSWHDNGYRMHESVLKLVESSKDKLYEMWNEQHDDPDARCVISVYPCIEFSNGTAVICSYSGEHAGGISDRLPMDVCKATAEGYRKMGLEPIAWRPVSKHDYDAFVRACPGKSSVHIEWDENGAAVASISTGCAPS